MIGTSQGMHTENGHHAGTSGDRPPAVLITGIGCIGKSSLRRRVASALGSRVVEVDRDEGLPEPEVGPDQVLVVESVHGLDEPPERWGLVVYLLPPPGHSWRWIRRGLAWFRTGRVDRPPRAVRRAWSPFNLPLIFRILARNIRHSEQWVRKDLDRVDSIFHGRVLVTRDPDAAFQELVDFITYPKG